VSNTAGARVYDRDREGTAHYRMTSVPT
jgi:hypothetical protein